MSAPLLTQDDANAIQLKTRIWQGMELEQAAAEVGIPLDQALDLLAPVLDAPRTRAQLRLREQQRLEWQHQQIMDRLRADAHDDAAHDLSMKLSKEKSKLMGLNAPVVVEQRQDININISWAGPERLSYAKQPEVIDMAPATATAAVIDMAPAATEVPWREPAPDNQTKVAVDRLLSDARAATRPLEPKG